MPEALQSRKSTYLVWEYQLWQKGPKPYQRKSALFPASIYFLNSSDENRVAKSATKRKCQFWQEVLKAEECHEAPFRIRRLGFRISFGRTKATTDKSYYYYFGRIFGKSLTGIRCRAVDSLIRVGGCFRGIRRILSPLVHCQIREIELTLN